MQYIPAWTHAARSASSFLPVSQCGVYHTWLSALGCCSVFFIPSLSFHFDSNRSAAIASSSINQVCAGILTRASNSEEEISKGFFITYYSVLVPSTLRLPPGVDSIFLGRSSLTEICTYYYVAKNCHMIKFSSWNKHYNQPSLPEIPQTSSSFPSPSKSLLGKTTEWKTIFLLNMYLKCAQAMVPWPANWLCYLLFLVRRRRRDNVFMLPDHSYRNSDTVGEVHWPGHIWSLCPTLKGMWRNWRGAIWGPPRQLGRQGGVAGHWPSVSNEGAGLVQSGKEELLLAACSAWSGVTKVMEQNSSP